MPLDPQLAQLLEQVNQAPALSAGTPEQGRELFSRLNAYAASVAEPPAVASVEEAQVDGAAGPLPARIYRPESDDATAAPTLAFFHGGGFTIGDIETHDLQCRLLCRDVGAVVVSVEYRLAPDDPFPAAADDALAATRWVAAHIGELGGDRARLAVGGDSAGANLSAGVAQAWRGTEPPLAVQLLLYPATDMVNERPSYAANAEGYFLTRDDMEWFRGNYLPGDGDRSDPRASPALAGDLHGVAPAIVATAELDPLRDDGDDYADALRQAGVQVVHRRFDGLIHGFFAMGPFSAACAEASAQVCADLRALLA